MSNEWVMKIPSKVYSHLKNEFSEKLKAKYKMTDSNFSTVSSATPSVFPFVFLHSLPAVEQGRTLDGTSINGGLFTFQIDVIDNQTQKRAQDVMTEAVRIMKTMRFEITAMPSFEGAGDGTKQEHRMTARFRRVIGNGDIL